MPAEQPSLIQGGGGGGDRAYDFAYWLTPMPPPGDLTIVVAWPTRGIEESSFVLPADAVARGVANVIELWPRPPLDDDDDEPVLPPKPVLPEGGWFAEHASDDPPSP
jgi:hypothetical protein